MQETFEALETGALPYLDEIRPELTDLSDTEVLIVGDSESDLMFSRISGVASCWAAYGYGDAAACQHLNPHFATQTFGELRDILRLPSP